MIRWKWLIKTTLAVFLCQLPLTAAALPSLNLIYSFQGGLDGAAPGSGLAVDKAGNLFGITEAGGRTDSTRCPNGCGTAFELSPPTSAQETWTKAILPSGDLPVGGLAIDRATGNLFGMASVGGRSNGEAYCNIGCGGVFEIAPPTAAAPGWNYVDLYDFQVNCCQGLVPTGVITRGPHGILYGTTKSGGLYGFGTVFRLHPPYKGITNWPETIVWAFRNGLDDGSAPLNGVIADSAGTLYGASSAGPADPNCGGSIFKIVPTIQEGLPGTLTNLAHLVGDAIGCVPTGPLHEDKNGVFYGTMDDGGTQNVGDVYTLTPPTAGQTTWTTSVIHSFALGAHGAHPDGGVTADKSGKLYGTTAGYSTTNYPVRGANVFQLTPPALGQTTWSAKDLATFNGANGASPMSTLIFAPNGKLYGTTKTGGAYGYGTVFELTR